MSIGVDTNLKSLDTVALLLINLTPHGAIEELICYFPHLYLSYLG